MNPSHDVNLNPPALLRCRDDPGGKDDPVVLWFNGLHRLADESWLPLSQTFASPSDIISGIFRTFIAMVLRVQQLVCPETTQLTMVILVI